MTMGLTSSDQTTAIKAAFAANDVRTFIANHLGVSVGRVTDDAHFTHDLGADWLDRLELMVAVEDQFVGVEITDDEIDQIEVVGDLIRHIETMDSERRRRGAAPVFSKLFGPHLARAMKPITQQEGCEQVALFFLRLAGEAMRNLMGWCPETRQPIDLQIYVDDATLTRIWSNVVRFQCPHCGTKHETKVERLASRPLSLEPPQTKRTGHQPAGRCNPQCLRESDRDAAQQTDRPQRESIGSEDRCLDEGGREAPQQTGSSGGTGSSRKPPKACRRRAGSCNPSGIASVPNPQRAN